MKAYERLPVKSLKSKGKKRIFHCDMAQARAIDAGLLYETFGNLADRVCRFPISFLFAVGILRPPVFFASVVYFDSR